MNDHMKMHKVAAGQEEYTCSICNASVRSGKAIGSYFHREGKSHESLFKKVWPPGSCLTLQRTSARKALATIVHNHYPQASFDFYAYPRPACS